MIVNADIESYDETLSDEELGKIVLERPHDEESVVAALKALSRRKSALNLDIFRAVLDDPEQSAAAKKVVILQLGRENSAENRELLSRHLDFEDEALFASVAQSLGRIGDAPELERLEKVERPGGGVGAPALEFAKSLLSYRLRLERHYIATPDEANLMEVSDGISFEVGQAKPSTIKRAIREVEKHLPAVPLTESGAVVLSCRAIRFVLAFNADFRDSRALETIVAESALPLVMLKRDLSLGRYFMSTYFFTHPVKRPKGVALLGTRPTGELTYAGTVHVSQQVFGFSLKSVDSRYAPAIDVEGSYHAEEESWEFTKAVTTTVVAARDNKPETPPRVSWSPP